ncbi:uncharacterized protein LOC130999657 isoform X2 [Salvia miltiorrhiza]|uniref:uncharacterized protein LOC130999657 isoform X2 n=1 Tax=Salvia miltiorrhiza TaxID=226208 RepID=UPI0025ACCB86|nr:uncharacterized protein LOC130999657 isoform X2 [Salvia miltiorrhiza]
MSLDFGVYSSSICRETQTLHSTACRILLAIALFLHATELSLYLLSSNNKLETLLWIRIASCRRRWGRIHYCPTSKVVLGNAGRAFLSAGPGWDPGAAARARW